MSKRKFPLTPELDTLVRVTPEQTQEMLSRLPYKIIPPEESKNKRRNKKQLYCPYCGEYKLFKAKRQNGYIGYKRCTGCNISDIDFHVRRYNKGFGKSSAKR